MGCPQRPPDTPKLVLPPVLTSKKTPKRSTFLRKPFSFLFPLCFSLLHCSPVLLCLPLLQFVFLSSLRSSYTEEISKTAPIHQPQASYPKVSVVADQRVGSPAKRLIKKDKKSDGGFECHQEQRRKHGEGRLSRSRAHRESLLIQQRHFHMLISHGTSFHSFIPLCLLPGTDHSGFPLCNMECSNFLKRIWETEITASEKVHPHPQCP